MSHNLRAKNIPKETPSLLERILQNNALPFGFRVGYVSNFFSGPIYKLTEQDMGIRRPEFATLFCLHHLGTISARDICELTGIAKNTISRAVSRLNDEGYVISSKDPADSRRSHLQMTSSGKKTYLRLLPLFETRQDAMLSTLTPEERKILLRLLDKLVMRSDHWNDAY
jgi:MarR family transcriptional regulator, temperature-dependent positive regulator of motility